MDHPSNGVSILGCLIPAFADEEFYVRRLFHHEDSDYDSDEKGNFPLILECLFNIIDIPGALSQMSFSNRWVG